MALLTGLVDYHIHTRLCGHARGEPAEYLEQARTIGLSEIGFSDHFPLIERDRTGLTMSPEELPFYYEWIAGLREGRSGIPVKVGIEVDYVPGAERRIEKLLGSYRFDYVLGSVHHVGELDVSSSKNLALIDAVDFDSLYADYLALLKNCIKTGLFDVVAHLDVIKKHGHRPSFDPKPRFESVVEAISAGGMCIEVNSSGLRKPAQEPFPSFQLLRMCNEAGIPIVLGSDAHRPSEVGAGLDVACAQAGECGYSEVVLFSDRAVCGTLELPKTKTSHTDI
ncbi:MAG: hypothetical protein AMJ46_02995 [Latescibacteria bacterium DG_63]|nr:MAG: hypothetical protein AMJ46_02995 [Latescibacteria bacterium DG_63]